ncbi:glycosyltransferase family 2 protein [Candidatus Roizmanbacteria bacterium]|nr:glycosyltransferase family 2 protein [Candidatus Roizmanbacteria bacterium]
MLTFDLSIIIISYNTKAITLNCLNSVLNSIQKIKYEIIVIDNASNDDSYEEIKKLSSTHSQIRIIRNQQNTGFSKANNQASNSARSAHLLFLNSDILVQKDAIEKMYTYFKQDEKTINFLGGKLLNRDLSMQPSCGPFYSLPVIFTALYLRGDYWGLTRYSPNVIKQVDWVSGACIMTKKEYFEKIGGFDEGIFMYIEEIDLFYRVHYYGYSTFFYPEAQFIHLGSASSGKRTYPILQVFKGLIYFYQKYYPRRIPFLKFMLQLKARIGVLIGALFNNNYLKETYGKALSITELA